MPIRNRAGKWHYRFFINGMAYTGPTGLDATERNKTAAMRKEAEARRLVLEGKERLLKLEVRTFNDAAEQFLLWVDGEYQKPASAHRIKTSFVSLSAFFKKIPVTAISPGHIDDFKAWRRTAHEVRDVTIRHDLHNLSLFFQYCIRHNWLRDNPVTSKSVPSDKNAVRIHVLTDAEEMAYFAAGERLALATISNRPCNAKKCADRYQSIVDLGRLMLNQGCRPEELMELRKADVDLTRGTFRIIVGKTEAAKRNLKMTEETRAILARRMAGDSNYIFPGKVRGTHATKLNNAHEAVLKAAGLEFVIYDFRHTFATRMARVGMPLPTLAAILGHNGLRSIAKYIHIQEQDMHDATVRYSPTTSAPTAHKSILQ